MNKAFLVGAIVGSILVPLTAAAQDAPGVTKTEVKIGSTYPFSGPASAYAATGKGVIAYVDYLNAKGGINGRKINFVTLDDAYSPPKAVEQTRKLVEAEEVAFIFAPLGTATNSAIVKYLNGKKVPHLFIFSGGSKFANFKEYPYTTTGLASYETEGRIYAKYIADNMPNAKIALLYQNDDLGKDFLNALKLQYKDDFAKKVTAVSYEVTDPTIDSQVVNLKNSGADVFILGTTPKFAAQALRKAHELGWTPTRFINVVSNSIAATLKPAGLDISNGVVTASFIKDVLDPKNANDSALKWYREELFNKYLPGADVSDTNYMAGVTQGMILEQVLKQCGDDLSRENVLKQSRSIKNLQLPLILPGIAINTNENNSQAFTQLQLQRFNGSSYETFGDVIGIPPE